MFVDVGSGYNPKLGYLTCDVNAYCDFHSIDDIPDSQVKKMNIRNVLHHVFDLDDFFQKIYNKLSDIGVITITDCAEKYFKQNLYLDNLWYRWIFNRKDIYIHNEYRDIKSYAVANGFSVLEHTFEKEKEILLITKNL